MVDGSTDFFMNSPYFELQLWVGLSLVAILYFTVSCFHELVCWLGRIK